MLFEQCSGDDKLFDRQPLKFWPIVGDGLKQTLRRPFKLDFPKNALWKDLFFF